MLGFDCWHAGWVWALQRGPPHCTDEDTEARRGAAPGPEPTPPGSSFHPVGQVSRPPSGLPERVADSLLSHTASPASFQSTRGLFLLFSVSVVDSSPGVFRGAGGGGPSGTATGTASTFQGNFGTLRALSAGLSARSLHHRKGQSRTSGQFTFPQGLLCALQVTYAVLPDSHTDLMRLELSGLFR